MIREVLPRVDHSVKEVAVLSVLLRLKIKLVEQLVHPLCELCDLHVRWTRLDLALDHGYLSVLVSKKFFLLNDSVVLLFVLSVDLPKNSSVLFLLDFLAPLLHLCELIVQSLLLFLTTFLQLCLRLS